MGVQRVNFTSLNTVTVAAAIGVTRQTIYKWNQIGMPRNNDDSYSLPDVIAWLLDAAKANTSPEKTAEMDEAAKWMTEYRKERAKIAKLERQEREGDMLSKAEVIVAFTRRCLEFANGLQYLNNAISTKLAAETGLPLQIVSDIIKKECNNLLNNYCAPMDVGAKR